MTREQLIEKYGTIEAAKEYGYKKKPYSNEYVLTTGTGKANQPRKYTRYPKGDPRHKKNS